MAEVNKATNKNYNNSRSSFFLVVLVFLFLSSYVPALQAEQVTLAWDPNPEPSVTGYRVYYGTASGVYTNMADAGRSTEISIKNLEPGKTYFFAATAYNAAGDESGFSAEIVYATGGQPNQPNTSSSGSSVAVQCLIATAAYGNLYAPEVTALREFRDRCLMTNRPGRAFVELYYSVSPPIAAFISEHEALKAAVRVGLMPVIFAIRYPTASLCMLLLIPAVMIAGRKWRKWQSGKSERSEGRGRRSDQ